VSTFAAILAVQNRHVGCYLSEKVAKNYSGPERRRQASAVEVAPVRLTRKYADSIDGIDLSERQVGDRLPLPSRDARMLIAEGWAEPVASQEQRTPSARVDSPDPGPRRRP
jgi:hypothetical protein